MAQVRAVSLYRLSYDPKQEEVDIPKQRMDIHAYCERRGWSLVSEYTEAGVSAFQTDFDDRDELQKVLESAKRRPRAFDAVIVWKLDRLARDVTDLLLSIKLLEKQGIRVYSLHDGQEEPWSTRTAEAAMRLFFKGYQAQGESENISLRTAEKKRFYAAQGQWMGGYVPFGYRLVMVTDEAGNPVRGTTKATRQKVINRIEVDPQLAPVVREMFQRYVNGAGYVGLAKWLNAVPESVCPRPRSGTWNMPGIRWILSNPIYKGQYEYVRAPRTRRTTRHPMEGTISADRPDLRIVEPELWNLVQQVREEKAALHPRMRGDKRPYSGILRCGVCGTLMGATSWSYMRAGERVKVLGYRCTRHIQSRACVTASHKMTSIEQALFAALASLMHPTGLLQFLREKITAEESEYQRAVRDRQGAEKRLAEVKGSIDRAYRDYYGGKLTEARFQRALAALEPEEVELTRLIAKALPQKVSVDFERLAAETQQFSQNWPFMQVGEQKAFLAGLCRGLHVEPLIFLDGHIEFRPKAATSAA